MASSVLFEPVPAITGILFFTVLTVTSITYSCSSCERVGDSPVVPQGTIPCVPFSIWNSMRSLNDFISTFPFLNGVTIATIEPCIIKQASFTQRSCHCEHIRGACTEETEVLIVNSVKQSILLVIASVAWQSCF